jgi:hypothetical protein
MPQLAGGGLPGKKIAIFFRDFFILNTRKAAFADTFFAVWALPSAL